jgi:HAMP domain-containing protein
LCEQVQDLCTAAQALSAGNLSARATLTSRGDLQVLKLGLNGAADGLAALCSELRRVALEVVVEGKLAVEMRHPNAQGEWQGAQDAVNRMLATIATSWRAVAAYAERVIEGEYEASTPSVVQGELGAPAQALQRLADQQERTQTGLQALIDGRFGDVHAGNDNPREFALIQLGMRLKREWFRSTRAGVYEAREHHTTTQGFAEAVLSSIAQTVSAAAGAYYHVGDDQKLIRIANLGCEPLAQEAPIGLGEGLLGKVAFEGRALLLDKLDQQGSRVRTGLLEITPRAVLLFPIKRDQRVCAVLELLFVNDAAATALELLDYLAHDLAKGPTATAGAAAPLDAERVRALEEELVIANTRLECVANELQLRDRAQRTAAQ